MKKNTKDEIMEMANGDTIALTVLARLIDDKRKRLVLGDLNIIGVTLSKLYTDLCDSDMEKLKITIDMFDCGTYSEEEIAANLAREDAYPFFDESIESGEFLIALPNVCRHTIVWDKFCDRQRANYLKKYCEESSDDNQNPSLRRLRLLATIKSINPFM